MLYPVTVPLDNSVHDLVGYIDSTGAQVVPPTYVAGSFFSGGLAAVVDTDSRTAFLDVRGRTALPAKFTGLGSFHEGLCAIGFGAKVGYIDRSGKWTIAPDYMVGGRFSEGFAPFSPDGQLFGILDREGHVVVAPRYEATSVFHSGLAAVSLDGKWGYLNPAGSLIVPCMFDGPKVQPFINGWAGVSVDSRWGFVDRDGRWLVTPQYDDVKRFSEGLASVKVGDKWGVLSMSGKLQLAPTFDNLLEFEHGMAAASLEGKSGFISPEGRWLIERRFDKCYPFVGDLAVVVVDGRYSYILRSGETVWTSEPGALPPSPPFQD
jgi:hypothetical protein